VAKVKFVPKSMRLPGDVALPPPDAPLDPGDESYVAAQTRRMRAAADTQEAEAAIRNLELGKVKDDLIQVKDVKPAIETIHRQWVDALDILPSNVIRVLGPIGMDLKEKIRTAIEDELNRIREDLANVVPRKR
jgi:hypothetical protein